jgi:hypothetical protein
MFNPFPDHALRPPPPWRWAVIAVLIVLCGVFAVCRS